MSSMRPILSYLLITFLSATAFALNPQSFNSSVPVNCEQSFKFAALRIVNQAQKMEHKDVGDLPLEQLKARILDDSIKIICVPSLGRSIKISKLSSNAANQGQLEIYILFSKQAIDASNDVKGTLYLYEMLKSLNYTDRSLSNTLQLYQSSLQSGALNSLELKNLIETLNRLSTEEGGTSTGVGGITKPSGK